MDGQTDRCTHRWIDGWEDRRGGKEGYRQSWTGQLEHALHGSDHGQVGEETLSAGEGLSGIPQGLREADRQTDLRCTPAPGWCVHSAPVLR